jgi:hydroxymethylbilane synthase
VRSIRLGTRGSKLALWQAEWVERELRRRHSGVAIEIVVIRVESDRQPDVPITAMNSRGIFVRDIEVALLEGRIDAAVHSLKDLPSEDAPGLEIVAASPREDPRDALLTLDGAGLAELRPGAFVGTSSLRRTALVHEARRDLAVLPIRGNVDTRLRKLRAGEYDAIVMAAAALNRLSRDTPAQLLPPDVWVPAVAQGIIGVQARAGDTEMAELLSAVSDPGSELCARVERSFLRSLGGGCSVPVGGLATLHDGSVSLTGFVGSPDGERTLRASRTLPVERAHELGHAVAGELASAGGDRILGRLQAEVPIVRGG